MDIATQFAVAQGQSGSLFSALGIDWKMLLFQVIAFLILVWLMGKYVYPILLRTIDARQEEVEASAKAAQEAEAKADATKAEMAKLLKQARDEASDIVSTAKEAATAAVEAADAKAKTRADHVLADAHEQIEKDIIAAKKALHNETLTLVALATEKVIGKAVTAKVDEGVIAAAIKEVK